LPIDSETARWLATAGDDIREKLAEFGLIEAQQVRGNAKLIDFVDNYIESRRDVKKSTWNVYNQTRRCLLGHFGPDRLIRDVLPADADEFRVYLKAVQRLGENTLRRRIGVSRQFFKAAIRARIITENPFADIPAAVQGNEEKFFYITREMAQAVLDECPNAEWRLLFALARFGGLRTPSESLLLRWSDVNWEKRSILVTSPKTEHHPGKESRVIPMFPELVPYLEESFEHAAPGAEWVITKYRDNKKTNLRTHLQRIIKRAGMQPWPKLWQNLRSTRETELLDSFPISAVCKWIGNSEAVARKHYLQTTEEHFAKAVGGGAESAALTATNGSQLRRILRHPNEKTPRIIADCGVSSAPDRTRTCDLMHVKHAL